MSYDGAGAGGQPSSMDGNGSWSQGAAEQTQQQGGEQGVDAAFRLQVEEGGTVSATFPFFGDPGGGQLSFQIGDTIKVRRDNRQWGVRRLASATASKR